MSWICKCGWIIPHKYHQCADCGKKNWESVIINPETNRHYQRPDKGLKAVFFVGLHSSMDDIKFSTGHTLQGKHEEL